jgi:hypothetical protein
MEVGWNHSKRNETWNFRESRGQNVDPKTFGCKMYVTEHGVCEFDPVNLETCDHKIGHYIIG